MQPGDDDLIGGLPILSRSGVRSLRIGDPIALPTPDGDVIRYEVERRGFTGADTCQLSLRSGGRESTYGVIVQRGPHLAGFLQRIDGRAYRLMPAANGTYRLDRVSYPAGVDCGVGRVEIPGWASAEEIALSRSNGLAGGAATPCPPEAAPFDLPPTLRSENGMIIDVLFVFSQDAANLAATQGRDIETLASLAIAQANLAMFRSTDQPVSDFDGQDNTNNLNQVCGYGSGGFPVPPPPPGSCDFGWPAGMSGTCKDDESPVPKTTTHATLAGVTPAEADVCTPRLRLVAALVTDGFFGSEPPYSSTGLAVDLGRVQNPADGYIDYVPLWRDALGADSVCFVGLNYGADSAFIGLASVMNDANNQAQALYQPADSVVAMPLSGVGNPHPLVDLSAQPDPDNPFDGGNFGAPIDPTLSTLQAFEGSPYSLLDYTAIDDLVYAHEHGHNMGCQHNHDNGSPSEQALFPDSFGYRTQGGGGAGQEGFKTVMSYGNQVRLPGYSNPNQTWFAYSGNNPEVPQDAAGIEFDFACTFLDGDGTDVRYNRGGGINTETCLPPASADEQCENETDEDPGTTDPAAMVVRADVNIDDQLDEDQTGGANNARSISQAKFDFAKFRCSVFPIVDCNDDTVDDFLQAVDGFLEDCDANGVPDQCESTTDPASPNPNDCNGNGVPDSCDISSGESPDDNSNLIPDECEDQTVLFAETFERTPFGFVEGAMPIARVEAEALEEIRETDPDFPEFFATIETVGLAQAPGNGGYVFFDALPNAFQYRLGGNGARLCPDNFPEQSATSGFAVARGNRGYGQALNFNTQTGDFPSQAGITTVRAARDCKEIRFYINAADFTGYFEYEPPLPLLQNYPYLEENVIFITAFNEAGEVVFEQNLDLRNNWFSRFPGCSESPNPSGFQFVRIGAPLGSDTELAIRSVEIRGAFVVLDDISFDAGLDNSAFPCVADIAGGPLDPLGLPTPDGKVGGEDLLVVLASFGFGTDGFADFTTCPPDPATPGEELPRLADINEDCQVDGGDLLEVLAAWGQCLGGVP